MSDLEKRIISSIKEQTKSYGDELGSLLHFYDIYYTADVDPDIYRDINIKLKHNLARELEILDNKLNDEYSGHIDFYEAPFLKDEDFSQRISEEHLEERATEAFTELINPSKSDIEKLLYFYSLAMLFANSILGDDVEKIARMINYEIFDVLTPYVTAKKLQKEFSSKEVELARKSITSDVDEVDLSRVPPYLINDNSALISKNGKYYLVEDIIKAITAAGGVAQTLERQDLEGGMTNASRQGKSRQKSNDDDEETSEDSGAKDSSGVNKRPKDDEDKSS